MSVSNIQLTNPAKESIIHIIPEVVEEEVKYPIYRSKFSKKIKEETKRKKMCHRTMGFPSDFPRTPPEDYLKKRTRIVRRPVVEVEKPPAVCKVKVPTRDEMLPLPEHEKKDFVMKNVRDAVHSKAKHGPYKDYHPTFCRRITHRVYCSPRYVLREDFGKVPDYLLKRKQNELRRMEIQKKCEEEKQKDAEESLYRLIPSEERQQILDGLKKTWSEIQKEYQLLPMLNDTPPKIKRKEKLERDLVQIENDIKLVERFQKIYVCNNERFKDEFLGKLCKD